MKRLICRWLGHKWGVQGYNMVWEPDGGGYPLAIRCDRCGYFGTRKRYPEPFV
jgi:hypothetical protein